MPDLAYILGDPALRLWGLTSKQRLLRQLRAAGITTVVDDPSQVPGDATLVVVNSAYLFEQRTIAGLCRQSSGVLECPRDSGIAAAVAPAGRALEFAALVAARTRPIAPGVPVLRPHSLAHYDDHLRRHEPPLLEPIRADNNAGLESILYGNSYKGITDCVTKWLWPRPARLLVRGCANAGISPNAVTLVGLGLVLLAGYLFAHGAYAGGLLCGWIMTLLDTVDGKLARVTVQSSALGHALDHGIDIVHPPVWYVLWGYGLGSDVAGGSEFLPSMNWLIVGGYLAGRAFEGMFAGLGSCSMFAWRPFDAYFRLITARRNPCLIILSITLLARRPDWGLAGVAAWTTLSSAVLGVRLLYATTVRIRRGRLSSWLSDPSAAVAHTGAYRTFSGTRGAYD